jgi:hypothetical protein
VIIKIVKILSKIVRKKLKIKEIRKEMKAKMMKRKMVNLDFKINLYFKIN